MEKVFKKKKNRGSAFHLSGWHQKKDAVFHQRGEGGRTQAPCWPRWKLQLPSGKAINHPHPKRHLPLKGSILHCRERGGEAPPPHVDIYSSASRSPSQSRSLQRRRKRWKPGTSHKGSSTVTSRWGGGFWQVPIPVPGTSVVLRRWSLRLSGLSILMCTARMMTPAWQAPWEASRRYHPVTQAHLFFLFFSLFFLVFLGWNQQ